MKLAVQLKEELDNSSGQKKAKILKRLEVVEAFRQSGNKPEWMVIDILPVIPRSFAPWSSWTAAVSPPAT